MLYLVQRYYDSTSDYGVATVGTITREILRKGDQLIPQATEYRDELQRHLLTGVVEVIRAIAGDNNRSSAILEQTVDLGDLCNRFGKNQREIQDDYFGFANPMRTKLLKELASGKTLMMDDIVNAEDGTRIGVIMYSRGKAVVYTDKGVVCERDMTEYGFGTSNEAKGDVLEVLVGPIRSVDDVVKAIENIKSYDYYRHILR